MFTRQHDKKTVLEVFLQRDEVITRLVDHIPPSHRAECWLHGGAVVDSYYGGTPRDYDILAWDMPNVVAALVRAGGKMTKMSTVQSSGDHGPAQPMGGHAATDLDEPNLAVVQMPKGEIIDVIQLDHYWSRPKVDVDFTCNSTTFNLLTGRVHLGMWHADTVRVQNPGRITEKRIQKIVAKSDLYGFGLDLSGLSPVQVMCALTPPDAWKSPPYTPPASDDVPL